MDTILYIIGTLIFAYFILQVVISAIALVNAGKYRQQREMDARIKRYIR